MGKVIVPQPNEKELAAFALQGLTMLPGMTEEEFIAMATDFLNRHNVLHLATCKNNEPRCTPLEYFNNGLTVYVFSEGGGKIANLKANDLVSYSISDPYDPGTDFFGASGLQVWGRAMVFKKNTDLERFKKIQKYSRYMKQLDEQGLGEAAGSYNFNVLTIEPFKMRRLCYREGMRNVVWKKDA